MNAEAKLGPLFIALSVDLMLFAVSLTQIVSYFQRQFGKDKPAIQITVCALLLVNAVMQAITLHTSYRLLITQTGDPTSVEFQGYCMWLEPALTAIVASLVQGFYLQRFWLLTKSVKVMVFLLMTALLSVGSGIAVSGFFFVHQQKSLLLDLRTPVILWLVSTSVTDVLLAGALVARLVPTKLSMEHTETALVIGRLIRLSVTTASLTVTIALLDMLLFVFLPNQTFYLLPQWLISCMYTITFMAALATRRSLNTANDVTATRSAINGRVTSLSIRLDALVEATTISRIECVEDGYDTDVTSHRAFFR